MRPKSVTLFITLIVVAIFLIFFSIKGIFNPVESTAQQAPRPVIYIFSSIGRSVKSFFTYFGSVHNLNKQNALLTEQVRTLQQDNINLQQYKVENDILKKELSYRDVQKFELISGTVIASDPTGFSQTVIINIGSSEGVQQGSAVLAQGVLVGRVSSVDTFTSKVLLITDPQSTFQASIAGTSDNGIVRGSYGSGILLDTISQSVKVNKGDQVVTAGLNPDIPRGILIGSIGEVQSQKNDLLQNASVVSGADLKNLYFLSVIKK